MAKYLVLYSSATSASELMANASSEQMKASMDEWMQWREKASQIAKIDFGLPLQAVGQISPEGITKSDSQVSGYSIMEGETKEAIMELLQTHPHLKREGASIDVLEMLSMPGL